MVRETSLFAYREIKETIPTKRNKVFNAIKSLGSACDQHIAEHLGWPINCVTPRRNELIKDGLIEDAGMRIGHRNRNVHYWRVASVVFAYIWLC